MTGRPINEYRRYDGALLYSSGHDNSGLEMLRQTSLEAELGSAALLRATQAMFRHWERTNGFVEGAAQLLLPAGWRPQ